MLVESMHQIVRIEFRNAKFPYTELGGSAPFQPPPGGAAPWIPVFVTNFTAPRWKQSWICWWGLYFIHGSKKYIDLNES